jgi:hypothetical protein
MVLAKKKETFMNIEPSAEVLKRMEAFTITVTNEESWEIFNSLKNQFNVETPRDLITKYQDGEIKLEPIIISKLLLIA